MVLIAHNELGHEEEEVVGPDGEKTGACTLYPGLRCRDHVDISVEVDNSREDHLPRVEFVELCPNSWLIAPTGGLPEASASDDEDAKPYVQIEEDAQFTAQGIEKAAAAFQQRLGDPLPAKHVQAVREILATGASQQADEAWNAALLTYGRLTPLVRELPRSLRALVRARLDEIEETLRYTLEEAVEDGDAALVRALADASAPQVLGGHLPVHEDARAWLAAREK